MPTQSGCYGGSSGRRQGTGSRGARSPIADPEPSTGVAQGVAQGVVLRSDALLNEGSNVKSSRKCSCIFVISNRPNGGSSPRPRSGPTVRPAVGDVRPHKARCRANYVPWPTAAGVCGHTWARRPHSRRRLGSPSQAGVKKRTCNFTNWSYDVRPPRVGTYGSYAGGRTDGKTRARRRDCLPARRRPLGGGLRERWTSSALCPAVPAGGSRQASGGSPGTRAGNRSLGFPPAG
jgi:hypothetical protein